MAATGSKIVGIAGLALSMSLLLIEFCPATTQAVTPSAATDASAQTISGEVMKISSKLYVVRDANGNGTLLQVSKDTQVDGSIRDGDTVQARIASDGHALSVIKSSTPGHPDPRHAGTPSDRADR